MSKTLILGKNDLEKSASVSLLEPFGIEIVESDTGRKNAKPSFPLPLDRPLIVNIGKKA